jgi:hypothetical protein
MKTIIRILLGVLIVFLGTISIKQSIGGIENGPFTFIQYTPIGLHLLSTLIALLLDSSYYRFQKRPKQFIISFIGILFCIALLLIKLRDISTDNSKTLYEVTNLPGASHVMTFEFKINNHFRLTEYDRLGHTIFYGKYELVDDSLKIIESNYEYNEKILLKFGIINRDTIQWKNFDKMIIVKK